MALILSAYLAVFSSQLFFNYHISSILIQSRVAQIDEAKLTNYKSIAISSKTSSQKQNIVLSKRFQKQMFEFVQPLVTAFSIPIYNYSCEYFHLDEISEQVVIFHYSSRGPPNTYFI